MTQKDAGKAQPGIAILETMLVLPVVLFLIFFLILFATVFQAKYSLRSAIQKAVRMAESRESFVLPGPRVAGTNVTGGFIGSIDSWNVPGPSCQGQLPTDMYGGNVGRSDALTYYQGRALRILGTGTCSLPVGYHYALAYTYQSMNESVGGLNYPCEGRPGCLACYNLNSRCYSPTSTTADNGECSATPGWDPNWYGVRCKYVPPGIFVNTVTALIRYLAGPNTALPLLEVNEKAFFPV